MDNKKSNSSIFDKLKLNSWEVEILIVGFLLIVLLQLPESIINEIRLARLNFEINEDTLAKGLGVILFYGTVLISTKIIIITLISYILLRSFWVGLLGLSSVFPKGINLKKLKYSKYITNKLKSYNLDKSISYLDKLSSTIFSFAFLITLSTISFLVLLIHLLIIVTVYDYVPDTYENIILFIDIVVSIYIISSIIYLFDYLSFGLVKKMKWKPIAYIYDYIYIYFNYVSLGFIYNSLYYTYISNIKARFIFFPLAAIISLIYINNSHDLIDFSYDKDSTMYSTSYTYYADERKDEIAKYPFIQSYIINENILNLHIPYRAEINSGLKNICSDIIVNTESTTLDSIINIQSNSMECLNSFYSISIDNVNINSNFIFKTYSKSYNTFNMIIPLNNFKNGKHTINIIPPDTSISKDTYQRIFGIPFYLNK